MRRTYLVAALAALLLSTTAMAEDRDMGKGHRFEPVKTRQEAIARVKERLAKLEAMSDEEWNKKHTERKHRREARRAQLKDKRDGKHDEAPAAGAPAATPATPTVPEVVEKR